MMSLPDDKQADIIDAFYTTSKYLEDIFNIDNVYFDTIISQIYPSELHFNKAYNTSYNTSDTESAFKTCICQFLLILFLPKSMINFDFEIVIFPFLDGDVPLSRSYEVYISQLIRFARASSHDADFNTQNKLLTLKLLKQCYRYHKLLGKGWPLGSRL